MPLRSTSKLLKKTRHAHAARCSAESAFSGIDEAPPAKQEPSVDRSVNLKSEPAVKLELSCADDLEEVALQKEYELKLAQLRVSKNTESPAAALSGNLNVVRKEDGSLNLIPKTEIKKESEPSARAVNHETDTLPIPGVPDEADLDEYTRAAMNSLRQRNEQKKRWERHHCSDTNWQNMHTSTEMCRRSRPAQRSVQLATIPTVTL